MTEKRSRHIPRETVRELAKILRDRCCLCETMIDPNTYNRDDLSDFLEKHHIIFFSLGGEHTVDNLLLVCPTCHAKVHAHAERFSADRLRKRKSDWIAMTSIVDSDNEVEALCNSHAAIRLDAAENLKPVLFSVESLNLQYTLWISEHGVMSIGELARAAFERVLKPLAEADSNKNWLRADHMDLGLRSDPSTTLPSHAPVHKFANLDDPFIGHLQAIILPYIKRFLFDRDRFAEELRPTIYEAFHELDKRFNYTLRDVVMRAAKRAACGSVPPSIEESLERALYDVLSHRWPYYWRHDIDDLFYYIVHATESDDEF